VAEYVRDLSPGDAARFYRVVREAEGAAAAQGFADCEALMLSMLSALAEGEDEHAEEYAGGDQEAWHRTRAHTLREVAVIVSLGQHRTDAYDPDEIAKAHASALGRRGASKGGSAGTKAQTDARKANQKLAAAARRKEKS